MALLTVVAALVLAPVASATVTITGISAGAAVTSIPGLTITSTAQSFDVALTPTGQSQPDLGATGQSGTLIIQPRAAPVDGSWTLTVTETAPPASPPPLQFTVDSTPPNPPAVLAGPPVVTGPSGPFAFSWSLAQDAASAHWQLLDFATLLAEGDVVAPAASVTVVPGLAPGDRTLNFRVALRDALGNQSQYASWPPFIVDQTPPGAPVAIAGPVGATTDITPSFAWQGTELGGTFEWDVTDSAGKSILGPGAAHVTTGTSVTTPTLPLAPNALHRLTFHLRQVDPYGNRGPERTLPFTITTLLASQKIVTQYAQFMTPAAGRVVTSLRPMLRWRRLNPRTTIFNVQIWTKRRKLLSKFPTGTSLKVPKGILKPGTQYVWYVWSYVGKKNQLARRRMTSYFLTKR